MQIVVSPRIITARLNVLISYSSKIMRPLSVMPIFVGCSGVGSIAGDSFLTARLSRHTRINLLISSRVAGG